MLPLTPISKYMRDPKFVTEEWQAFFRDNLEEIENGWRGILIANWALVDPTGAWKTFTSDDWDPKYIDDGASLSWYLWQAASLNAKI